MEAVEFQAKVKNGAIEIPEAYQTALEEGTQIKVIEAYRLSSKN